MHPARKKRSIIPGRIIELFSEVRGAKWPRKTMCLLILAALTALLGSLRADIECFAAQCPGASQQDYCARFGTPEDIAMIFLAEMPHAEIDSRLRSGKRALRIACATAAALAVIAAASLLITIHCIKEANDDFHNGYIIKEKAELP